ncbi:2-succinyl-6-hydroxy-2,4-cyclohexadiene-1-carboxylate synthase [Ursidibacter maritimus]|uniref:Putative 2-succinyl-6-hydroxy-2,4-cyclohexadiene-1-carboxylate synthase n=1 Tax=Ursidibacter maritimus TaxID=1331689 RepID=A0A949SZE6_9PAST|nr:2-succinyl-6-hydroxy-2,4-cyclohexadiene-1-carboxylate synthase [Ursidibacter maritimus]KAE9542071.1 2-succinyl-6-hydroxy-2,4-cyclohexadiene-1-carboxylate synthase [Ursidibacter maritimus]MBV6524120.1 2-succinyl-6-hydroxy-2,4-cyclohexadiene-1-carboxylate synthase [Ursidibacter maritimus]MBV6525242.1 2-succinyl-6-hydroxy-2,4-cyclohexadiene-1-carboxylate synthase [Ursidibacter maritimus]MBV6527522.1 2-succinyl-6-hydroxy-2,4-cyclohexadiene-1-carboxylate synthase [Ursidibacter maritimus]MBV65299
MLAYQWHRDSGIPLVFLHGLLGSQQDWQQVICLLQKNPQIRPLTLDLPCHNQSQHIDCRSFSDVRQQLYSTLNTLIQEPFYLVGYSLGGRIALDYLHHQEQANLLGVVLEGANIGLQSEQERQTRWLNDQHWAKRFRTEPLRNVLEDWYQQTVFADLDIQTRADFIQKRQDNCGEKIAQMLEATSLAKQPFFDCKTRNDLTFFIGEKDQKFRQMVEKHHLPYQLILNAGHNAHQQSPDLFVKNLLAFIERK